MHQRNLSMFLLDIPHTQVHFVQLLSQRKDGRREGGREAERERERERKREREREREREKETEPDRQFYIGRAVHRMGRYLLY